MAIYIFLRFCTDIVQLFLDVLYITSVFNHTNTPNSYTYVHPHVKVQFQSSSQRGTFMPCLTLYRKPVKMSLIKGQASIFFWKKGKLVMLNLPNKVLMLFNWKLLHACDLYRGLCSTSLIVLNVFFWIRLLLKTVTWHFFTWGNGKRSLLWLLHKSLFNFQNRQLRRALTNMDKWMFAKLPSIGPKTSCLYWQQVSWEV